MVAFKPPLLQHFPTSLEKRWNYGRSVAALFVSPQAISSILALGGVALAVL